MTKILSLLAVLFLFFSCAESKKAKDNTQQLVLDYAEFIPKLDAKLNEISGIMVFDSLFWGFNDSGGKNRIYGFSRL